MPRRELPPFRPAWNGGIHHPRDHNNNLRPSPLAVEQERVAKATMAREEAQRGEPLKSFNTLERERLQDESIARTVAIQRAFWCWSR